MRVLIVDRRQVVGVPVQCAEYIPAMLMGHLDLDKSFIVQKIQGMMTYLPDEPVTKTRAPGFTIDRELFDQALIQAASDAGAKLMLSTRALQRLDDDTILLKRKNGQYLTVCAKIIVGADGPRSTVGRWVGAVNRNLLTGVQATLPLMAPMDWTEVYFRPGNFCWLRLAVSEEPYSQRRNRTKEYASESNQNRSCAESIHCPAPGRRQSDGKSGEVCRRLDTRGTGAASGSR